MQAKSHKVFEQPSRYNRGNCRRQVFHKDEDYQAFLKAISHACVEIAMPVLGYCLMPNHFQLVLWPQMHWVQNTACDAITTLPK